MKFLPSLVALLCLNQFLHAGEPVPSAPSPAATAVLPGLGSVVDPSNDCRIAGSAERLTIAIPGSDHALDVEANRVSAPRVLQEVTGDFSVEVTVSGTYPENTGTIVANRRPFHGAGLLVWVTPDTYVRLERAQVKVEKNGEVRHFTYPSWELRLAGKPTRYAHGSDGILTSKVTSLRISRKGNTLIGAVKEDGSDWRELDPLTLALPETVQVGLSASHNTTSPFEAVFEGFSLVPASNKAQ